MKTLLIDTHFSKITIVLYENGLIIDKVLKESNQSHSIYTMPLIKELLCNNNTEINDIKEIIVVNGPGSFTGVRIGVTIAKTIAYSLKIPIKVISSLELIIACNDNNEETSVSINDRNGYYIGEFNEKKELIKDYFYLSNKEYNEYKINHKILENDSILDYNAIYNFSRLKNNLNPHEVNPLYVKKIEALK